MPYGFIFNNSNHIIIINIIIAVRTQFLFSSKVSLGILNSLSKFNDITTETNQFFICFNVIQMTKAQKMFDFITFPGSSNSKEPVHKTRNLGSIPGSERSLEKDIAIHSTILAWRIP